MATRGDPDLMEAERLCRRWSGRRVGETVPCKSTLIGRTLNLRVHGRAEPAEVVACAVPRSDKPSKRCKPAYRVKRGGLFPQFDVVDGGKVRNASRTPRATHGAPAWEMVSGKFYYGPREAMRLNTDAGAPAMLGLDLPYPHRVGSAVCCPDHAANALVLAALVRDEYETEGQLSASTRGRLRKLAAHLTKKHAADLPGAVGPEDWQAADAITSAGDAFCARLLSDWQTTQEESGVIRREEARKARARKKGRAKTAAKSRKTENARAVKALQRQSRAKPRKAAGALVFYVSDREGDNVGVTASNEFATRAAADRAMRAYMARTGARGLVVRQERLPARSAGKLPGPCKDTLGALRHLAAGKAGRSASSLHGAVATIARVQLATGAKVLELDARVGAVEGWMAGRRRLGAG